MTNTGKDDRKMTEKWAEMGVRIFIILIIVMSGFGVAVRYLWNWLMPQLFGLHPLTYWQALGLLGLSWLLFGGFGWLGGGHSSHRNHITDRFAQMTPEERTKFREGLSGRC
jgi:Ca2+/H+ antiporter, TMEM165/GDT1 family